jgi:hypothetical protein
MRIGFFVWEYPPQIVGGLGTYSKTLEKLVVRYLIATNTGEIADELRKIVRSRVKR